jgi:hypothetical protein
LQCPSCSTANPESNHFCGSCGVPLDQPTWIAPQELARQIDTRIDLAVSKWKEQKLVDVETTQAITDRLQTWAKLFAFFAGIPLLLLLSWLSVVGYNKYSDLIASVDKAQGEVQEKLKATETKVGGLQDEAVALGQSLQTAKATLATASALEPQVQKLSTKVDALEHVANMSQLKPDTEIRVGSLLLYFRNYLSRVGFRIPTPIPTIRFDNQAEEMSINVIKNEIVLTPAVEKHPGEALGPYAELLLHALNKPGANDFLPNVLSCYYASSFDGNKPHPPDKSWTPMEKIGRNDALLLWRIRELVGKDEADRFVFSVFDDGSRQGGSDPWSYLPIVLRDTASKRKDVKLSKAVEEAISSFPRDE